MNKHGASLISQKGTILIVALLIVVLVEIVVFSLVINQRIDIRHSRNYFAANQGINIALGAEEWAKSEILAFYKQNKPTKSFSLSKTQIQGGYIEGDVTDIQGHFNINNLINNEVVESFNNLLVNLAPNKNGLETDLFSKLTSVFAPFSMIANPDDMNFPFSSITELRPFDGMSRDLFLQFLPNMFVLPGVTPLNINSATKYSLLSLSPKLTMQAADSIIKIRDSMNGFTTTEAFSALGPLQNIETNQNSITIQSEYFLSSITVHYENIDLTLNSLLKVIKVNNGFKINVEWRSFGTL